MICDEFVGQWVLLRTVSAGVHFGKLQSAEATASGVVAVLLQARRIWRWDGSGDKVKPYTLSEVSQVGPGSAARVAQEIARHAVVGVIEILPCSAASAVEIQAAKWA